MKRINILLVVTLFFMVLIYFFAVRKTSTLNMEWSSFKIHTKTLISLIAVYSVTLYFIFKKLY